MKQVSKLILTFLGSTLIFSTIAFGSTGVNRATFTRYVLEANEISSNSSITSDFTDLEGEDAAYVATAKQANIVSGYEDNTFKPNDAITKEQAIIVALNGKGLQAQISALTDEEITTVLGDKTNAVSSWAKKYVAFAVKNNVVDLTAFEAKDIVTEDTAALMISTIDAIQASEAVAEKPLEETVAATEAQPETNTSDPAVTDKSVAKSDLSATDMLLKSSELSNAKSTYKMSGTTNSTQKITMGSDTVNTTSKADIEALFEMPDKLYMNLTTTSTADGQESPITIPMEMYLNGKTLLIKGGGLSEEWQTIDSSLIDLESLTGSSEMLTADQIKGFSEDISFGEDKIVDGKTLHAIKIDISSDSFKEVLNDTFESMSESMTSLMDGILAGTDTTLTDEERTLVDDMLDQAIQNMVMSGYYTYYVDSETMLPVQMDAKMTITMPIEVEGETMNIVTDSTSSLKMYDFGEALEFPVVE